jgi:hypothetical protein
MIMNEERLKNSVSDAIASDSNLAALVCKANATLLDIIGQKGPSATADWSLREDEKGRTLVILNLRDFTGRIIEVKFAPDEHGNFRDRLYRAWGDLLQPLF